jgi:hypothetical protein
MTLFSSYYDCMDFDLREVDELLVMSIHDFIRSSYDRNTMIIPTGIDERTELFKQTHHK